MLNLFIIIVLIGISIYTFPIAKIKEKFGLNNSSYYLSRCVPNKNDPCVKKGVRVAGWYNLPYGKRQNMCIKDDPSPSTNNQCCKKRWPWVNGCCTVDFEYDSPDKIREWSKQCN